MKKISAFLMTMLLGLSFVFAHEKDGHSKLRQFISPEFNLTEIKGVMSGTFKKMPVWIAKSEKKGEKGYRGWIIKEQKKLPFSIIYRDNVLHGYFNGKKFVYLKADAKKQTYTFKIDKDEVTVSFLYETKSGRHMINPLFVVKNNGRNYLVRLIGECCLRHGLYYAATIYGLTFFDEYEPRKEKKETK